MRDYSDPQYKKWRLLIYKRDHYCCQWPNCSTRKTLQAHHIHPWSQFPGLRYHPDNGITLCKNHHKQIQNNETSYAAVFLKILANNRGKL